MRVIAGTYRSRLLTAPRGWATRPTSDRLRETLFNILSPRLQGCRFVDLYAGTGAVGIEALSRGAAHVWFAENAGRLRESLESALPVAFAEIHYRFHKAYPELVWDVVRADDGTLVLSVSARGPRELFPPVFDVVREAPRVDAAGQGLQAGNRTPGDDLRDALEHEGIGRHHDRELEQPGPQVEDGDGPQRLGHPLDEGFRASAPSDESTGCEQLRMGTGSAAGSKGGRRRGRVP